MSTLTIERKMLYCPKCKREYDDGSQRFCESDGGRLLPAVKSGKKATTANQGVFTSLLGRTPSTSDKDERLDVKPKIARVKPVEREVFEPPTKSKMFRSEAVIAPVAAKPVPQQPNRESTPIQKPQPTLPSVKSVQETGQPSTKPQPPEKTQRDDKLITAKAIPRINEQQASTPPGQEIKNKAKPPGRMISPREISTGRAPLGDRATNPQGRTALSWNEPASMLGQVVKGRYRLLKTIGQEPQSIVFLAEDKILKGKNVVVRVLRKKGGGQSFEDKIFLEERISLSHVNHPNVAKVIDSGELPEGNHFIVTSELRTSSVETLSAKNGELNPLRVARIIRQASYALSEVHQSGILHRNVKPEHILLTVSEAGIEQVKVTDFCVSDGTVDSENFRFKAPEQIGGQLPTFASDSYALAVIAYRLFTNRFPYQGDTEREVLNAQKTGLIAKPSELNSQLPEAVDPIFIRALEYDPAKRFPKARDFGEMLFNALSSENAELAGEPNGQFNALAASPLTPPIENETLTQEGIASINAGSSELKSDIHIDSTADTGIETVDDRLVDETIERIGSNETLWQNRSPEPVADKGVVWTILPALGILLLFLIAVGVWWQFFAQDDPTQVAADQTPDVNAVQKLNGVDETPGIANKLDTYDDSQPVARNIVAPPGSVFYENSRLKVNDKLAQNFQGFSLYYPQKWKIQKFDKAQDRVDDKFLDIALNDKEGRPIEHLMIEPYGSSGTFTADTERFADLVEKSNKDIANAMPGGSFKVIEQGVTTIQNGRWKAYQVNFEVKGKAGGDGKALTLWGRRLWIPIQNKNSKTGFIITMLATSLSDDVKKAQDVGRKGDLESIIQTFEPKL